MKRLAVVVIMGSTVCLGCVHSRSVMPGVGPINPAGSATALVPIGEQINGGYTPTDPALRRASLIPAGPSSMTPRPATQFTVPKAAEIAPKPIPDEPPPLTDTPPNTTSAPPPAQLAPLPEPPPTAEVKPNAPASAATAAALPELPIPDTPPASALSTSTRGTMVPTAQVVKAPNDPKVQPVNVSVAKPEVDPTRVRATIPSNSPLRRDAPVTQIAATIGTEEITLTELQHAVKETLARIAPDSHRPSPDELNELARMTLDDLIQRAMLVQAAKRKLKDEKNWGKMLKAFEKVWVEQELPQQLQKNHVTDEHELEQVLKRRGMSLKTVREDFVLKTASIEFLRSEIVPKVRVDLPELRSYYQSHLAEFQRGPLIHWREVEVKVSKHKDRAEARSKIEGALARLRRGESFDTVARSASEGNNADKGGVWATSPDSVGIPAINDTLNSQAAGQISPILEAPNGFHIVLVESRSPAGPAPFSEVHESILRNIRDRKFHTYSEEYFQKLRARTLIYSMFDGTASAPTLSNAKRTSKTRTRTKPKPQPQPEPQPQPQPQPAIDDAQVRR